jgi:hypothetical protein
MSFHQQTHVRRLVLLSVLAVLVFPCAILAQSTAAIRGTVTDQSGASVPNAAITVQNQATGEQRSTMTDQTGTFLVPALPVGTYRVSVKATGLQPMTATNLVLEVGRTVQQDFALKVAASTETVEVTAAAPVIEQNTVSVGGIVNQATVQEIPLNGRHFVDLGLLIPGSVTPPQNGFLTAPLRGQGSFGLNTAGNREDTVNFMINGINLNDMVQNQITFQPSINTVQEFKADNSTYEAQYGRSSGSIINIATRAGTNEFHGEAFEFVRNDYFDARNYFNKKGVLQSPFKRNQFGGSVGGPILKDKTFFFLSYEGLRQRQGLTINQQVLTAAQRQQGIAIGNPTVTKLLPLIPEPNLGASVFGGSATAPVNIDQGSANISHNFSASDRINGYLAIQQDLRQEPTLQGNNVPGWGDTRSSRRQIMTLNETHVFSPTLVNEARLGYNRIHISFDPNALLDPVAFGMNTGVSGAFGLPQITVRDIGLNFGGPAGFPQGRGDYTAVASDTLSYIKGTHSLKFGGEVRRFNGNSFGRTPGTMAFNTVTDFLNGSIASFTANPSANPSRVFVSAVGAFAQDSFKLRPSLMLVLGLRWEWNGTPTEAANRFVAFDTATSALVQVGSNGFDRVYKQNYNLQPRVGFAWNVLGSQKTVLRGAYALMSEQPVTNLITPLASNPPFANPVSVSGGSITFANAFSAAKSAGSLSPTTVNPDFRNMLVQSWNLNIQQELPFDLGLMAGYFGNKGSHLRIARNINQFLPGTSVRPYPAVSASSAIAPGVPLAQMQMNDSAGNSIYNAFWITATKRLSKGLQFNASYTFSKSIDYNSLSSQGIVVQDSYNIRNDRGLSDFDARHRFVISGIYALPFRGNRVKEGWQVALVNQLQSGNPVTIVTTNQTLTGFSGSVVRPDVLGKIPTSYSPAANGNIQYFPSAACTTPAAGCIFLVANHFGNLGRNVVIGPGFENVDFSVYKNTKLNERLGTQFRAEFFNLFNHPNFGQPNRVVSTAANNTFGQISSTRFPVGDSGSSRQVQLALKFIF